MAAVDGSALTDAASEIAACAVRTLAEPSARMAYRTDWTLPRLADMGLAARLIGTAVKAYWNWNAPDTNPAHLLFEGFAEPATGRYMADGRGLAELRAGGITFFGRSGRPLDGIPFSGRSESGDSLWHLRLLPGTARADPEGTETLRGTLCRKFTACVDVARAVAASRVRPQVPRGIPDGRMLQPSLELTVWIDDQHVRQICFRDKEGADSTGSSPGPRISRDDTLELWDFGVPVGHLDWSRLPGTEPAEDTSSWLPWRRNIHRD